MKSKKKTLGIILLVVLKLILDILELQQMKSKKKGLRCVKGKNVFLNSLKGVIKKKSLGNPCLIQVMPV